MCSKQPGRPLRMVMAALVLRVWWETRPWAQEAHSGTGEMPRVTASEVNSGLWLHRHKLETHNNCQLPSASIATLGYVVTWPKTKVSLPATSGHVTTLPSASERQHPSKDRCALACLLAWTRENVSSALAQRQGWGLGATQQPRQVQTGVRNKPLPCVSPCLGFLCYSSKAYTVNHSPAA